MRTEVSQLSSSVAPTGSVSSIPPEYENSVREVAPFWLDLSEEEVDVIVSNSRVASVAHLIEELLDHTGTLDPKRSDRDLDRKERQAYRELTRAQKELLRSLRSLSESILDRRVEFRTPEEMARQAFEGIELRLDSSDSDQGGEE